MPTPTKEQRRVTFEHVAVVQLADAQVIDDAQRIVEGWASTTQPNCYGAVMHPEALAGSFEQYLKNPVVPWCHDTSQMGIARVLSLQALPDQGIRVRLQFGTTDDATQKWEGYKQGLWRALSLGFDGEYTAQYGHFDKVTQLWHWTGNCTLCEISGCVLPADSGALLGYSRSLGLDDRVPVEVLQEEGGAAGQGGGAPERQRRSVRLSREELASKPSAETAAMYCGGVIRYAAALMVQCRTMQEATAGDLLERSWELDWYTYDLVYSCLDASQVAPALAPVCGLAVGAAMRLMAAVADLRTADPASVPAAMAAISAECDTTMQVCGLLIKACNEAMAGIGEGYQPDTGGFVTAGLTQRRQFTATTYADLPLTPEETAWDGAEADNAVRKWASSDGSGDKETVDWPKYRQGFLWYDPDNAEVFGGYKLGFATVIGDELQAVWRGCAASMGALMGARGGVDVPEDERQAVYNHLVKYYERFDKTPPEFVLSRPAAEVVYHAGELEILEEVIAGENAHRFTSAAHALACIARHWRKDDKVLSVGLVEDTLSAISEGASILLAGRVLSESNRQSTLAAIAALQEVLDRADAADAVGTDSSNTVVPALVVRTFDAELSAILSLP